MTNPLHEDPILQALAWLESQTPVALATVLRTWGSAPRQAGSMMCMHPDGAFVGSVSGGCVESAVVKEAQALLDGGGDYTRLTYGVSNEEAWEVGLACGGSVEIGVQIVREAEPLRSLQGAREAGRAVVLDIDLTTGESTVVEPSEGTPDKALAEAVRMDRSGIVEAEGRERLLAVFNPPVEVLIIGAVHIAQPLSKQLATLGFGVTIIDPREAFATAERFPDCTVDRRWPEEAMSDRALGHRTAVVTVTHDPKLDDPALRAALASEAFYIGALGSRRTHAKRVERLDGAGFDSDDIGRIHAPVGLDIGARTPAEIATSVTAQIVGVLRGAYSR